MPDNYMTTVTEKGTINIAEDVIDVMVAAAIAEVDGVVDVANTVGNEILDLIGMRTLSKGVKVSFEGEAISIDVLIMVAFGCVVSEVARNVHLAILNALESMTGQTAKVNVHVSGVSFPKSKA